MPALVAATDVAVGAPGLVAAVAAGVLSFLSPCVLPLVPSYVAFLAGVRGTDHGEQPERGRTMVHAVAFVVGFSIVFVLLGASATALGSLVQDEGVWLSRAGGVLLVTMGLVLVGAVRIDALQRDTRLLQRAGPLRRLGPAGSVLIGAAFGAGWTPCIGPVLAGILAVAATGDRAGEGAVLLAAYSLGLAVPFLAAAFAIERFGVVSGRLRALLPVIERVSGVLLVLLGVLLASGLLARLSTWTARFTPAWLG